MKTPIYDSNLHLDKIEISRFNVRHTNAKEDLDKLAKSIDEIGIQQPVVVFKQKGEKDKYELIIGQRRYLACKKLNWKAIPAYIKKTLTEKEAAIISFSENIQRLDLSYKDKMDAATELKNTLGTIKKVADALGVSPNTVSNYLGYSAVPQAIKELVDAKQFSATTALLIAKNVPDEKKAIRIAHKVKKERSSAKRSLILNIAKENPDKSASAIIDLANKKYDKITIYLTPNLSQALRKASQEYDIAREDIVIEATEEWLTGREFFK